MPIYAVIDTNALVPALMTKNMESPTVKVINAVFTGKIIPLFHELILNEYIEVLHRDKFKLDKRKINILIQVIHEYGLEKLPVKTKEVFPDEDDRIFYEIACSKHKEEVFLVTGNIKHFPAKKFIVTPSEMVKILEECDNY